jgi:hypothetical protein
MTSDEITSKMVIVCAALNRMNCLKNVYRIVNLTDRCPLIYATLVFCSLAALQARLRAKHSTLRLTRRVVHTDRATPSRKALGEKH